VKLIPLFQRRTIRDLAAALGIPKSTLFAMKCDKDDPEIMSCTSALKPALTAEHELLRVSLCLTKMDPVTRLYDDYDQSIHVDEKWFFITEKALRLYIAPGEIVPQRRCQKKDHILKVMFLAAVACPRFNAQGECTFDGKSGIFPFVERVAAQRGSRNRPRGHIETKLLPVKKNNMTMNTFTFNLYIESVVRRTGMACYIGGIFQTQSEYSVSNCSRGYAGIAKV
jgi:hypothetical protein